MSTLLLRLSAAMQSWGVQSRFGVRDTGLEPSKSGVIGLLCAALGRPREAPIEDLAELKMGIRVDREGRLMRDYHTAGKGGYRKASGDIERKNLIVSSRYYLSDAIFLVGMEGDRALLDQIHSALRHPVWQLYLGRKAFPPGESVWLEDGLRAEDNLEEALKGYPLLYNTEQDTMEFRIVMEDPAGEEVCIDQPLSFSARKFMPRRVRTQFLVMEVG